MSEDFLCLRISISRLLFFSTDTEKHFSSSGVCSSSSSYEGISPSSEDSKVRSSFVLVPPQVEFSELFPLACSKLFELSCF